MTFSNDVLERRRWKPELYDNLVNNSILNRLAPIIIPDTLTLDVGGNTGYQAYWHSQYNDVITYEPIPELYEILQENMDMMGAKNIEFVNAAVGDTRCQIKLFADVNRLYMTSQMPLVDNVKEILVPMIKLDDGAYDKDIGFIKIDVEGYEMNVVTGSCDIMQLYHPHYMVEIYKPWCDKITPAKEYFEVFTANGYRTYYFNGMTKNFIQCDSIEQSVHAVEHYHNLHDGDFLFVHKDKKGPFDVSY